MGKAPVVGIADVLAGIKTVAECVRDIQKERTEQTRLRESARVEVERIHAMRDVLLDYLDRSFDERRDNFRQLFERLDSAIEKDNVQLAAAVLDSVVKLADASPFKALQDVAATRAALSEKGKEWQF
jgi:DNA polymerase III delta prime subunit